MMKKNIMLIRHAESEANAGGITMTPDSIKLTERGIQQARAFADSLDIIPALIVVSPFVRTRQTAQPVIEKYPEAKIEQWPIQEFTYLSPVRCRNTRLTQRVPWAAKYWNRDDPHYCDGDGAESFAEFLGRVQDFSTQLSRRTERPILVFGHQMFMTACLWLKDRSAADAAEGIREFRAYLLENVIPNVGQCTQ
jgi:broad specificity phosphatase PhoE